MRVYWHFPAQGIERHAVLDGNLGHANIAIFSGEKLQFIRIYEYILYTTYQYLPINSCRVWILAGEMQAKTRDPYMSHSVWTCQIQIYAYEFSLPCRSLTCATATLTHVRRYGSSTHMPVINVHLNHTKYTSEAVLVQSKYIRMGWQVFTARRQFRGILNWPRLNKWRRMILFAEISSTHHNTFR